MARMHWKKLVQLVGFEGKKMMMMKQHLHLEVGKVERGS